MWVYHRFCYTSSQYSYTSWCHPSLGQSVHIQVLCPCFRVWLSGLSLQACGCLCHWYRCRSTWAHLTTEELLFSLRQRSRRGWGEPGNHESLRVYLLCVWLCSCVRVRTLVRVRELLSLWISTRLSCHSYMVCGYPRQASSSLTKSHRLCHACQIFSLQSNIVTQWVHVLQIMPLYWFFIEFSAVKCPWRFQDNFLLLLLLCDIISKLPWQLFAFPKCEYFFSPNILASYIVQ